MRTGSVLVLAATLAVACDDSPTGPSGETRVEARVQDSSSGSVTGTLAGNFQAAIGTGDRWTDLGSANGITVALHSPTASTTVHGEQSVAAGSYTRVRLSLQGVTARVARGSVIGGTTVASDSTLTLGGSDGRADLVVDVGTFGVEANASIRRVVMFDLRSQLWLTSSALQAGRVEDSALQAAITATTRTETR